MSSFYLLKEDGDRLLTEADGGILLDFRMPAAATVAIALATSAAGSARLRATSNVMLRIYSNALGSTRVTGVVPIIPIKARWSGVAVPRITASTTVPIVTRALARARSRVTAAALLPLRLTTDATAVSKVLGIATVPLRMSIVSRGSVKVFGGAIVRVVLRVFGVGRVRADKVRALIDNTHPAGIVRLDQSASTTFVTSDSSYATIRIVVDDTG